MQAKSCLCFIKAFFPIVSSFPFVATSGSRIIIVLLVAGHASRFSLCFLSGLTWKRWELGAFCKMADTPEKDDEFTGMEVQFLAEDGVEITQVCVLDGVSSELVIGSFESTMITAKKAFIFRAIKEVTNTMH